MPSKASADDLSTLQNYFVKAVCEDDNVSNVRLIELFIEEPSTETNSDYLNYLRNRFVNNSVTEFNKIYMIRYMDRRGVWYSGFGIRSYYQSSNYGRALINVIDYWGNQYIMTYSVQGSVSGTSSWRTQKVTSNTESPSYQVGASDSISIQYDACCRVTAFRGSNWFDFTCDSWSSLSQKSKSSGFNVTATCSNKTITITNNTSSAINVIIMRGTVNVLT